MADFADMLGGDSDEDVKKPPAKKPETPKKVEVTPKKVEVKTNHIKASESSSKKRPTMTGIQAFTDGHNAEPDSPMRKKKMHLGQLSMKPEVCEAPKKFENLEKAFTKVWANYETNKKEFERFKSLSKNELLELRDSKLDTLEKEWQKQLEMHIPEGHPGQSEDLVEFNQLKSSELKEIEDFIHIFSSWVDETVHELEGQVHKPEKKSAPRSKQSSQLLLQANEETQNKAKLLSEAEKQK